MSGKLKKTIKILHNPLFAGLYVAGLFIFISYYIYSEGNEILSMFHNIHSVVILKVYLLIVLSHLIRVFLSQKLYHINGVGIKYLEMFRILSLSKLGRYVPGKIWFASGYYLMSRRYDIEPRAIAKNYIISNAMVIIASLICGIPALVLVPLPLNINWFGILLFTVVLMCMAHPRSLNFLFKSAEKLIVRYRGAGRFDGMMHDTEMSFRNLSLLLAGFISIMFISGLNLYYVLLSLGSASSSNYFLYLSTAALSRTVGLLAFFAPGGLGVQESIAALILSPFVSIKLTVMAVVALRVMLLINDVLWALISLLSARIWNSVRERVEVIFALIKLLFVKNTLFAKKVKDRLSGIYATDKTEIRKKELSEYVKQHAGDIFSIPEGRKLGKINIDKLSKSRAHDAFLVEAIIEDVSGALSTKKCVAKHYGLRGVYIRTKVNLIIYGRQILKMQRITDPESVMRAEIAAERKFRNSDVNMPRILFSDLSEKYIFSEFLQGPSLDEIIHGIFFNNNSPDKARMIFDNAGRMLSVLHGMNLVHGDTSLNNWIYCRERKKLYLIDWENVSIHGDPGFDLAHIIYSIGADAGMLDDKKMNLFDGVIQAILEGYDPSFTRNEYVKRVAHYWDNWILITSIRIQERIFRKLNLPCPRFFPLLKKIPIPVFNRHSSTSHKKTLVHKTAEIIQAMHGIRLLLMGKRVRRYPIRETNISLAARGRK